MTKELRVGEFQKEESYYECWIWIELIGFDNTRPDMGAQEYLDKLGFKPKAVSFLITSPDIIHNHNSRNEDVIFPPDYCSYSGHPRNSERERQVWTNSQLRMLIDALHAQGIEVYLATFTFFLENRFHREWVSEHLELLESRRRGKTIHLDALMPLKRFTDGTYYEDFFCSQIVKVMQDYNLDGWHAADGWGPARFPLNEADYSDDLVEQFLQAKHITLPPTIRHKCDDLHQEWQDRADWIWNTQRREWIDFYTERWAQFHAKQSAALHAIGKKVVINSAWTRDPFEAVYRYGIDYQKIIAAGVDGIVTESASGAADMEADSGFRLYNYVSALLLTKAFVPQTPLLFLHGVKDTKEQWDLIHHAPTVLEKELYSLTNVFYSNGEENLERCASGFVVCLGDGITREEWNWLQKRWCIGFSETPTALLGATLVWSDEAFQNELDDFITSRGPTTHRLLQTLMERGAAIHCTLRIEDVNQARGPLLVLNAHLFPQGEMTQLLANPSRKVILLGKDINSPHNFYCRMSYQGTLNDITTTTLETAWLQKDLTTIKEPLTFLSDLTMQPVQESFISECTQFINQVSGVPKIVSGEQHVSIQVARMKGGSLRITLHNSRLAYASPRIDVAQAIASIQIITEFPCTQIVADGSQFSLKVPGRGSVVVEVNLQKD